MSFFGLFGDDEEQRDQDRARRHGHPCNKYNYDSDECDYYNRNGDDWGDDHGL